MKDAIKPGKVYYAVAAAILIIGVVSFILLLISGIKSMFHDLDNRVVVPGKSVVELEEAGKYNIFFEKKSVIDGKIFKTDNINGLVCSLTNVNTYEIIELKDPSFSTNYSFGSREGNIIFEFQIDDPGKYELDAAYTSGEGEEAVLVIAQSFVLEFTMSILLCVGVLLLSIAISIVIFVITLNRRNAAKRSIMM